ncbi:MAG: NAD(P)H-hydrate dehydratase [Opitutales bacterium]|nr:NAD(P)H-hydrate dehydratase [Opitutales bacterium]
MTLHLLTHPHVSCAEAGAHEAAVLAGDDAKTARAMRSAGEGIGRALLDDYRELADLPERPRILLLAGNGLNAGDAFHAARICVEARPQTTVRVILAGARERLKPLTAQALEELEAKCTDFQLQTFSSVDALEEWAALPWTLLIDGLLGFGFKPPLRPEYQQLIEWANRADLDVDLRAAVDLPSGMGDASATTCLRADFSYGTAMLKAPVLSPDAAKWVGRLRWISVPEIPLPVAAAGRQVLLPPSLKSLRRLRPSASDKRSYGHVLVLAGSQNMPGAGILATKAALRSGAGLVTTLMPRTICSQVAASLPEAMWQPIPVNVEGSLEPDVGKLVQRLTDRADALLIGPGLRTDRGSMLLLCRIIRDCPLPLVLDASALQMDALSAIVSRPRESGPVIVTPHWGEFQRLRSRPVDSWDPEDFRGFCQKYRLTAVLKGPMTRISDGEQVLDVPTGGPVLARGGSGDLLAGILATCLAQHPQQPLQAAALATLWHGAAADLWARERGQTAVVSGELLDYLSPALRGIS